MSLTANLAGHFDEYEEALHPTESLPAALFEPWVGFTGRGRQYVVAQDNARNCLKVQDMNGVVVTVFAWHTGDSWEEMADRIFAWFSAVLTRPIERGLMDNLISSSIFSSKVSLF